LTVIAPWRDRAAAASSPVWRETDLVLDGYLTGVIIAPRPIPTAFCSALFSLATMCWCATKAMRA
jgi:hypothetical protein